MRFTCFWMVCICVPMSLSGDPLIPPRGVVNSASFVPAGLPGGAIAQGSIFSIFGTGLGPASSPDLTWPLQTNLGGVSVKVFQGSTSVNAYPLFVSPGQLNLVMPSNALLGRDSVQVTYNGVVSNPAPVTVVTSSFGIFAANSGGYGPGIVFNYTANSHAINSLTQPAMPGQVEVLWGTGLGPLATPNDNLPPPSGTLPTPVEVFVGGTPAQVIYSGRSTFAGEDQINFTVPVNVPLGCYVPVMVRTGGVTVGNSVSIAITQDGSSCLGTLPPVLQAYATGGKVGVVTMTSATLHADVEIAPVDLDIDSALAQFQKAAANPFFYQPLLSAPAAGTCLTYAAGVDLSDLYQLNPLTAMPGAGLDAGSAGTVSGAGGSLPLGLLAGSQSLGNLLGFNIPEIQATPYFTSGNYTLTTTGGADVGAVTVTLPYVAPVNWTNRDSSSVVTVNRSSPLTLNWTGAASSAEVFIYGGNVDLPTNSTGVFLCTAPPGAGTFTVPVPVLETVPPARFQSNQQNGFVFIEVTPAAGGSPFSANGLDAGGAFFLSLNGRTVMFQ